MTIPIAASDPADNPYWKRDVRRAYPQLSVVTQSELSALMIDHAQAKAYVLLFHHVDTTTHFVMST